jgi:hypothetical protein
MTRWHPCTIEALALALLFGLAGTSIPLLWGLLH